MDAKVTGMIIFFDGVCHLCNGFVDWVLVRDLQHRFCFAPLQGKTAEQHLSAEQRENLLSVAVVVLKASQSQVIERSDAVIFILENMNHYRWLALTMKVIPRPVRNFFYTLIAQNRYRIFGKREHCRLPKKDETPYLLP